MSDVQLDLQQVPARAELLLAAELGEDAPGRPIYTRPEPDGEHGGDPAARIKVGAVLTRRLSAAEAAESPSEPAYGNPLRGGPDRAPRVPIGSALLVRTDAADARGWRVYRVTPSGTVIYDRWIDRDPARAELVLAELRAAAAARPAAALRQAVDRQPGHASEEAITRWLAAQETARPSAPARPRSRAARRRWRRALARKGGRA